MEFGSLRQRILQLAVSGQLVEQLDSEPEVEQVGSAPKQDEVPFELPSKWKWVRAAYLGDWKSGQTPSRSNQAFWDHGSILWLKSGEITDGLISEINEKVTELAVQELNLRVNPPGSVVVALYGATAGKVGILQDFCVTNQACCVCINSELTVNWYLLYALLAIREILLHKMAGSAQPNLSKEKVVATWIPLPPIAEQYRIVAKVDDLLERLDQMEAAYNEFAGPMTEHFRNLMLEKAIRGDLVPQLDSEPEVVQVGPAPKPEEVPFELPPKWKWVPIKALFSMHSGKFIKAALVLDEGTYPCYGGNGIRGYTESFNTEGVCNIIGRVGAQCGNVHLAKGKYYVTDNAIVATHCDRIDPMCANLFLKALNLKQYATATAQPLLNVSTIGKLYYPLAPIEEQRRIVAKLDEVFAGVEKLGSLMEYA